MRAKYKQKRATSENGVPGFIGGDVGASLGGHVLFRQCRRKFAPSVRGLRVAGEQKNGRTCAKR